ncbi:hypothetical protein CSC94_23475 [Zhengella mangrovi]|uniref:histidine kinase n=1 Tax=Zhengella mangrovi TaxID=1982044 RepID=A0A2G1QGF0_9HYPH|nr:ATP-binding protein [Zhengella mangrovi]PHP64603.1 hypothetical protein CSC94_23475 [Zhengella mangrovi]
MSIEAGYAMPHAGKFQLSASNSSVWTTAAFTFLAFGCAAYLSIEFTQQAGRIAAFWPANGVLFAILWRRCGGLCPHVLLAAFAGNLIADMAQGDAIRTAVALSATNIVEVSIAFALASYGRLILSPEASTRDMIGYFLLCCIAASGVSAILAASYLHYEYGKAFLATFGKWWGADALGMMIVGPIFLFTSRSHFQAKLKSADRLLLLGAWVFLAASLVATFSQVHFPLLFLVYPALALIAFWGGFSFVAFAIAVVAAVSMAATYVGYGPLALMDESIAEKVYVLQLFLVMSVITMLPLGALVSDEKRAKQQVIDEKKRADRLRLIAENANAAKSEFLTSMSHELRTPLNAISGFAQLIEMRGNPANPKQEEYIRSILLASDHLGRMINDILDLAKIENGDLQIVLEKVEVKKTLDEMEAMARALAISRGCTLIVEPCELDLSVWADPSRVSQILFNLVSNAVKYGGAGATIRLSCEFREAVVRFAVSDNGPGVPPDRIEGLFKPFDRCGAEFGVVEGAGVGLAISRRLVDNMDGRLEYEVPAEGGALFWFELPACEAPDLSNDGQEISAPTSEALDPLSATNILYIEDNKVNAQIVPDALGPLDNINVVVANDGETGIETALRIKPSLIFLDIHLPDINGYEVLKRLRSIRALDGVPVYALTADAMKGARERAEAAGFDRFVTKPFLIRDLQNMVTAVLQKPTAVTKT